MTQREIRNEIFKILFERELIENDTNERIEEFLKENNISEKKKEFLVNYINNLIKNEEDIIVKIKNNLTGWTYERLGTVEKVVLKMAFYEILIENIGHEIAINEAIEITKIYGDMKTKAFVNGILADLIKK